MIGEAALTFTIAGVLLVAFGRAVCYLSATLDRRRTTTYRVSDDDRDLPLPDDVLVMDHEIVTAGRNCRDWYVTTAALDNLDNDELLALFEAVRLRDSRAWRSLDLAALHAPAAAIVTFVWLGSLDGWFWHVVFGIGGYYLVVFPGFRRRRYFAADTKIADSEHGSAFRRVLEQLEQEESREWHHWFQCPSIETRLARFNGGE